MLSLQDYHAQLDEALAINSIESSVSYEFYTDIINEQRALWIRNEYNKNRSVDPYLIQSLDCVELEQVNPIDCCIDVPTGCKVLRTVKKIPNTIEFFFTKGITSIGSPNITKARLSLIDYSRVAFIGHGRTTAKTVYAFLYDGYMYLISRDPGYLMTRYITIRGLFEDPTSLGEFINCETKQQCWKMTDPYPLNQWMWAYIKPYVLQQISQKLVTQLDDANNTQDNQSQKGQQIAPNA
jgi:hypothetical protein